MIATSSSRCCAASGRAPARARGARFPRADLLPGRGSRGRDGVPRPPAAREHLQRVLPFRAGPRHAARSAARRAVTARSFGRALRTNVYLSACTVCQRAGPRAAPGGPSARSWPTHSRPWIASCRSMSPSRSAIGARVGRRAFVDRSRRARPGCRARGRCRRGRGAGGGRRGLPRICASGARPARRIDPRR